MFYREGDKLIAEIESFIKQCIKKNIADIAMVIMYSVKSTFVRKYCAGSGKKRKKQGEQLMKMAPCMNEKFLQKDPCIGQFIEETKQLVHLADDSLKIPHSCW